MRIAKSVLIKPGENELYAIPAVALSLFCFAYSIRFGQVAILFYYALWLPLVAVNYRKVLGSYSRFIWLFAFAGFAFLSVFWSAVPSVSLRASIQYLTQVVCALIAVRVLDVRTLTLGVVAGAAVVLLYSILFGYYEYDVLDGTYSFVGAFASKNQLGFYASLGIIFAFAAVVIYGERRFWMMTSGMVGLMAAYCLLASQSATSVITTAAIIALLIGFRVVLMLSPQQRKLLVVGGGVAAVILVVAGVYLGAVDAVLGIFGKDSTLTGRTYLWQQGIAAAAQNPAIGIGYQAYWVQGFAEPERLWKEFFIASRAGFHFHNTYIETAVELGLIGVLILAVTIIATLWGHLRRLIEDVRNDESYFLFGVTVLLLIRSFVEIDVLTPYNVGTFLLYFSAGKLVGARQRSAMAGLQRYQSARPVRS
ncbi:O-antigen ligase family protein [Rhizobium mongolense]|uniref:Exopolysaccharide production protein ExoQ n=2 Tax=Rhizobium mongolense TaxID=57676 RepID=A0ABR6IVC2_9HYPH|nr:O-antigen ligase [Rhizobium mongolense]MBB4231854.1 exopolysaccharide production protein ExoQ [Rhizobium mongolense]TVZ66810.1 exopolysaccharide production protein ExoQ [Rhizobium mongolense USDA 1844]